MSEHQRMMLIGVTQAAAIRAVAGAWGVTPEALIASWIEVGCPINPVGEAKPATPGLGANDPGRHFADQPVGVSDGLQAARINAACVRAQLRMEAMRAANTAAAGMLPHTSGDFLKVLEDEGLDKVAGL